MMMLHGEPSLFVARDANAAQVKIGPLRFRKADRGVLIIPASQNGMDRNDVCAEDFLLAIDILQKKVERLHALAHSLRQDFPLSRAEYLRKQIANPWTAGLVPGDFESHAHFTEGGLHAFIEIPQLRETKGIQMAEQLPVGCPGRFLPAANFIPAERSLAVFTK